MKVKTAIPLLAAALLLAAPLAAQDRSGTAEISLFGGGYFGGTLHAGSNALFPRDVSIGTAPAYGARIGYNVNRWFGLEFGWSQTKPDITGMGGDLLWGQGQKIGEMTHNIFEGNAVFNMGRGRVIPYFTIGAGAMTFSANVPNSPTATDTRFVSNIGGGIKMFVTPQLAIRIDGRYRSAFLSSNDYYDHEGCGHDCYYYPDSSWYGSGEVSGGLTFAFGK